MKKTFTMAAVAMLAVAFWSTMGRADQGVPAAPDASAIETQVRHELVTLPFYGVYDDLNYAVMGDTVTLSGRVTRPTLKSDADAVVKRIPGIATVINQIEVLPLSTSDNRIRWAAYRALFNYNSPLFRYGLGGDPNIHIIVKNGHVTLKGVVSSASDKQIASMYMQHVFGVFSVTNELMVAQAARA